MKKALEKFSIHDASACHMEATMIWSSVNRPTITQQISREAGKILADLRSCLLKQLSAMKFLLRQGIALRGHCEEEGNLPQLRNAWAEGSTTLKRWIDEGRYMSHDIALMS